MVSFLLVVGAFAFAALLLVTAVIRAVRITQHRPLIPAIVESLRLRHETVEGAAYHAVDRLLLVLGVTFVALLAIIYGLLNLRTAATAEGWWQTDGVLIESDLYQYVVQDVTYQSARLTLPNTFFVDGPGRDVLYGEDGSTVTVFYNPADPQQSVLDRDAAVIQTRRVGWRNLAIGLVLLCVVPAMYVQSAILMVPEATRGANLMLRIGHHHFPEFFLVTNQESGSPESPKLGHSFSALMILMLRAIRTGHKLETGDEQFDRRFVVFGDSPGLVSKLLERHDHLRELLLQLPGPMYLQVSQGQLSLSLPRKSLDRHRGTAIQLLRHLADSLTAS
ncbi:MAG: DUF3592 domain-containing protein [Chloroflexi bacterium]|nr:DUF3592 domain-containing protein [Chloroflexota bacterium]